MANLKHAGEYPCPTPACTNMIEIVGEWISTSHCSFVKAECFQCCQLYWIIERGHRQTVRVRGIADKAEGFDERSKKRL